ncbi:MAG: cation-transporting P-type ATPase, partial [Methanoregula sp.]
MTGDPIIPDTTVAPDQGSSNGLTAPEVTGLRQQFGFNDLPVEKKHPVLKFLSYFWGPI